MKRHNLLSRANQLATNEDCRQWRIPAKQFCERLLHLPSSGVFVELVDRGVHTELREEHLDCVAHAA
ncbi:hypothetical protein AXF42_Ash007738 [Apostasia shenzhenica]|uniref:Uncharacterized protein n=1 Tax=Apostasia shenzhenica TaxID=1088818 RepID=A0A2I0B579_9ASPA|nr:hypothetical protein AXF42_Ash007738 [Apostasia shenzhenica]